MVKINTDINLSGASRLEKLSGVDKMKERRLDENMLMCGYGT